MARYHPGMDVGLTSAAIEQYGALPRGIQPRVDDIILRLARWPKVSGAKPLTGRWWGIFEFGPVITALFFG